MIEGLSPYRDYRPSDLPWLSRCPSHWRDFRLDRLFDLRDETPLAGDARVTGYLSGRVTLRSNVASQKIKGVIKDGSWKRIYPGDFAISGMNAHLGGMGVSDSLGKCSPIYLVLIPRANTNAHFVAHALRHVAHVGALKSYVNTIRFNSADFKRDALKLFRLPMPNAEEQTSIVRFINHANRRIEHYIRSKRKLITLLNEQKQAIIRHAVTGGIEPNTPMRDSGVRWLGGIPRRWAQRALWTLATVRTEKNPGGLQLLSVFLDRGVIRYEEGGGQVHAPSLDLSHYQVVHPGDFVLNNQQAWRGSVGVSRHHGIISPAYLVLKISELLDPTYANYLMRCPVMVDQFVVASKGVGDIQRQVSWPLLRVVQVPVPTLGEQKQIASSIAARTSSIQATIERAQREVSLINEYRTRLIADIVTGQLDVREAAARIPSQEPDQPDTTPAEEEPTDDDLEEDDPG